MRVGYTVGVFDLLHVGHVRFLQRCRQHCDHLCVALGTDRLVSLSKGRTPVIEQQQRAELVAALECVDSTVLFDTGLDNAAAAAQWFVEQGASVVLVSDEWRNTPRWQALEPRLHQQNITCVWLPHTSGISTTQIIDRIRR